MNLDKLEHFQFTIRRLKTAQKKSLEHCEHHASGQRFWIRAAQERDLLEKIAREEAKELFDLIDK